jgi:hypothetical protein
MLSALALDKSVSERAGMLCSEAKREQAGVGEAVRLLKLGAQL